MLRRCSHPREATLQVCLAAFLTATAAVAGQVPSSPQAPPLGFIMGRVVDATTNAPVPGVFIGLTKTAAAQPGGAAPPPQSALTAADGRFIFRDLDKGTYTLMTRSGGTGYAPSGFIITGSGMFNGPYLSGGYGQRRPDGPLQPIELAAGEMMGDAVIRLWKGAVIEGTVTDETGDPFVDVAVAAVRRYSDGRLGTGPSTRTDDRGRYRLTTLTPGDYLVVVPQKQNVFPATVIESILAAAPGSEASRPLGDTTAQAQPLNGLRVNSMVVSASGNPPDATNLIPPRSTASGTFTIYTTTFYPASPTAARATPLRLQAGETRSGVGIRLEPHAAVSVSGTLADSSGPVPTFGLRLMPADADDGSGVLEVATTSTDSRGVFEFPLVAPGTYTVRGERNLPMPGAAGGANSGRRVSDWAGSWARQTIVVGTRPVTGVQLALAPGIQVHGRVDMVGAGAQPAGRDISLSMIPTPQVYRTQGTIRGSVVTNGGIDFGALVPGRYLMTISAQPQWSLTAVTADGRDITDRTFDLSTDVQTVTVTLSGTPASISGTVRPGRGGPLDTASVFLFPADRSRWNDARYATRSFRTVRPSSSGAFQLPNVLPGSYVIVAVADGPAVNWPDVEALAKLAAAGTVIAVEPGKSVTVPLETAEWR